MKIDLALNNLKVLISHKTQATNLQTNQTFPRKNDAT